MLDKLLSPLTTARPVGTVIRDVLVALGAIVAILGTIGVLTEDQVAAIKEQIEVLSGQAPALLLAGGVLITAITSILRTVKFSSSDKAAEVAKQVDDKIPPAATVVIETPAGTPDIRVAPK
jgi:hypothetical protein